MKSGLSGGPTRANADELLESLGMQAYNRWGIVRKTHGVMVDDEIWIRFKGETVCHKDVCLRKDLYYPDASNEIIQPDYLNYKPY